MLVCAWGSGVGKRTDVLLRHFKGVGKISCNVREGWWFEWEMFPVFEYLVHSWWSYLGRLKRLFTHARAYALKSTSLREEVYHRGRHGWLWEFITWPYFQFATSALCLGLNSDLSAAFSCHHVCLLPCLPTKTDSCSFGRVNQVNFYFNNKVFFFPSHNNRRITNAETVRRE